MAKRRGARSYSREAALEAFERSCVDLFADGLNTAEIAYRLKVVESRVYNTLARLA